MTPSVFQLFLAQVTMVAFLWLVFFRRLSLPLGVKALTVTAYVTVPVMFAVKGTQSAVYLSDFVLPFLVFALMAHGGGARLWSNNFFVGFALLLIVLPIIFGLTYMFTNGKVVGFGARNFEGDMIWMYRNATFLLLFGYGLFVGLSSEQFTDFIKMNILLAFVLGITGLLNYFGPVNLAFFDQMNNQRAFEENYSASRVGLGFMGLFRGSVGQWFATMVVLGAATYALLPPMYRKAALLLIGVGVGMILLSYSRAGLVGVGFGLVLLGLFGSGLKQRITAVVGIAAIVGWVFWQSESVLDRVSTIYAGKSETGGRVGAWERTFDYLADNQGSLLLGVGPTNRQAVAEIAGTYGAHNEYLDVIYRYGITGFVVLLIVVAMFVIYIIRQKRNAAKKNVPMLNAILGVFLINCVMGLSQNHLLHDYSNYTMAFFLYMIYGLALGTKWDDAKLPDSPVISMKQISDIRHASGLDVRLKEGLT